MENRHLGSTGLRVSELGLGTMTWARDVYKRQALLGPGLVLTAEEGDADVHAIMLDKVAAPGDPHGSPVQRIVSAAVLAIVGGASQVELGLGDAVADTERVVFDQQREDPVERIYDCLLYTSAEPRPTATGQVRAGRGTMRT